MTTSTLPPQVLQKLQHLGQADLLANWDTLSSDQQNALAAQIEALDPATFQKMRASWEVGERQMEEVEPWQDYHLAGSKGDRKRGRTLLSQGKMGCVVLAGGQGERLGAKKPKGTLPVTVVHGKSLFQLLAEKTNAARDTFKSDLPLAIMTSPANHAETIRFFEAHHHFGLEECTFFQQRTIPLLDDSGNLFLQEGKIAVGPNGNGEVFRQLVASGIWEAWKKRGVEYLNIVLIDNPLADPFDAELLGFANRMESDLVVKTIFQNEAKTRVGILGKSDSKMKVVEYSELKGEPPEGALANLSLYCVSMELARQVSTKKLPLHMVKRKRWKFETFIFDLWDAADVLVYPKREVFAPLKSAEGEGGIESVQKALQEWDRLCLERLGRKVPSEPFELDPSLTYSY